MTNESEQSVPPSDMTSQPAVGGGSVAISLELLAVLVAFPISELLAAQFGEIRLGLIGTPIGLLVAHYFLRKRGIRWRDLGLRRPDSWGKTLAWTVAVIVTVFLMAGALVNAVLLPALGLKQPDFSIFNDLPGNLGLLLFWLTVSWSSGGFIEEMLARGFLLNRFRDLFHKSAYAYPLAVVAQAILFGLAHSYQGLSGFITTGVAGLVMGIYYLVGKRSLWPLILAHGTVDSIGIVAVYLGAVPV